MARSLTVKHEESPSTNPLFTGFIVFAAAWLLFAAFAASAGTAEPDAPAPAPVVDLP